MLNPITNHLKDLTQEELKSLLSQIEEKQDDALKKQGLINIESKALAPSKKQKEFHLSNAKIRIYCGGNYTGKTFSGARDAPLACGSHASPRLSGGNDPV